MRTKPRERRHPRSAARLEQAQAAGVFWSVFMTQAGEDVVRAKLCLLLLLLLLPLRRKGQRRAGRPASCGERQGNKSCRGTERNNREKCLRGFRR